jgi:mannose-6-phosphate isomerase-like protein (cupin superfamily)
MQTDRSTQVKSDTSIIGAGRRVVTGVNPAGKSIILLDGPVPSNASFSEPGQTEGHAIWRLPPGSVDLGDNTDPMVAFSLEKDWYPPPGGMGACILTWEPGFAYPMHQTDTLDIIFIISGRLELILESGTAVMSPGECVVQRGTAHSWRVVGDEPCTFVGFSVGATTNLD